MNDFTSQQLSQLVEYLLFEQQKRKETRTEISGELSDLLNEQIEPQTIYSGKDILELLEKLPSTLNKTVNTELERSRDLSVVLFENVFNQAQGSNITMELNVPDLEDEAITDDANLLCGKILQNKDKLATSQGSPKKEVKTEISEEELAKIQKEIDRLKAENQKMRDQLKTQKREWPELKEMTELLKKRNNELHDLQAKVKK